MHAEEGWQTVDEVPDDEAGVDEDPLSDGVAVIVAAPSKAGL